MKYAPPRKPNASIRLRKMMKKTMFVRREQIRKIRQSIPARGVNEGRVGYGRKRYP